MNLIQDKLPNIGQKFIAIYIDGSGCMMFIRKGEDVFFDANGQEYAKENLDNFLEWFPIPNNIKFWRE